MKLKEIPEIWFQSGDDAGTDLRCNDCGTPYREAEVESPRMGGAL